MSDIVVRPTRLADGRELIYFDDAGSSLPPERLADPRHLDPRPPTATMRLDLLTGDWVSIASARQNRAFLPPAEFDPLAPQSATNPSEVPSRYDVAVFENRSPSFGPALGDVENAPEGLADLATLAVGRTRTSVGRTEVVCFDPGTYGSFADLTPNRARTVVEAWAQRTAALSALDGVQQVFPFENRGEAIGVTLHHPHGQIYAYDDIPARPLRELKTSAQYRTRTGRCVECDVVEAELADGRRIVAEGEHFIAHVPFWARYPYEVRISPKAHTPSMIAVADEARTDLAHLLHRVFTGLDDLFGFNLPYVLGIFSSPLNGSPEMAGWDGSWDDISHLHLLISPPNRSATKLKYLAGTEQMGGAFSTDVAPEDTAATLREKIPARS